MTAFDTDNFLKAIFTVRLATSEKAPMGDFRSYADSIGYGTMNDGPDSPGSLPHSPTQDPVIAQILANIGDDAPTPVYFSKGKCRDTSIGGNDAINCYPQFNETDDVAEHPFLSTDPSDPGSGMGRVYSEVYDDLQQIMYITFGVPQFNDLSTFYNGAIIDNLAQLMNNGTMPTGSLFSYLVGSVIGSFVSLPALPLAFLQRFIGSIADVKITKYCEFKTAMPLYYRCVNSMIIHLLINMGLSKDAFFLPLASGATTPSNSISGMTYPEIIAQINANNDGTSTAGLPDVFGKLGFDIYRIMTKKYKYIDGIDPSKGQTSDDALFASAEDPLVNVSTSSSYSFTNFFTSFEANLYDASLFVGFRIEKGLDTSESFSNETGESSIAQTVNSRVQQMRDMRFTTAEGNIDDGPIKSFLSGLGAVVSSVGKTVLGSSIENIIAGAGMIDFPDIWKSSSFSKSYHFNMSLRSPYGDPYSILQNLYIPLSLLLGGAMPRGIGRAAYTSPFICRAYCKGMFAVPYGMINSMTIKRGADQFGWNTQRLPTCIDVSFEIKDMSPAMYLAMADGGTWSAIKEVFGANSSFQEYLLTLSGMGLADRLSWLRNLRRKAQYLLAQVQSSKLSPFYWGSVFGNSLPARMISTFIPTTKIPSN